MRHPMLLFEVLRSNCLVIQQIMSGTAEDSHTIISQGNKMRFGHPVGQVAWPDHEVDLGPFEHRAQFVNKTHPDIDLAVRPIQKKSQNTAGQKLSCDYWRRTDPQLTGGARRNTLRVVARLFLSHPYRQAALRQPQPQIGGHGPSVAAIKNRGANSVFQGPNIPAQSRLAETNPISGDLK